MRASACGGVGRGGDGVRALCACVRAYVLCARARSRGLPHTRERGCVRAQRLLASTLAMHHEAGPSVQMMRVRFCLEALENPS